MVAKTISLEEALSAAYPFHAVASQVGGWYVSYPDLPGCATTADTWEELCHNAREVLELWLTSEAEQGHPLPAPTIGRPGPSWPADSFHLPPATPAPDTAPTLGTREVADRLGVNPSRVRALAHRRGVGHRIGRSLAFSEADVAKLASGRPGRPRRTASRPR